MLRILITGGSGFLGQQLIKKLLPTVSHNGKILILDTAPPPTINSVSRKSGPEVTSAIVGITDFPNVAHTVKELKPQYVFHLASVMSGEGERDFDLVNAVNLDATRNLLEICRQMAHCPRFILSSSIAVFGGQPLVDSDSAAVPETSYGTTKAIAELLVADYTRKGFIDGSSCRLPTVLIRPGPPNPAATGCFASASKAVLNGYDFIAPISADARHPVISVRAAIGGLVKVSQKSVKEVGIRPVNLPAVTTSLAELVKLSQEEYEFSVKPVLARKKGWEKGPGKVTYQPDPETVRVVGAMPQIIDPNEQQIEYLGLPFDTSPRQAIKDYVNEHVLMRGVGAEDC